MDWLLYKNLVQYYDRKKIFKRIFEQRLMKTAENKVLK